MSSAGWIAIRADGSARTGTGHVMRCLTLANAFARRGITCVFICRHLQGSLPDWLQSAGHEVIELAEDGPLPSLAQGGYGKWLGTTQAHDADCTLRALANKRRLIGEPLLVVVDHYGLDLEWEQRVRSATSAPVAVIDDINRQHGCDFLIDATYGKEAERYRGKVPLQCVVMAGANYALLRPRFTEIRDVTLARRDAAFAAGEPVRHLLVAMGGADRSNTSARVLEALQPLAARHGFHTHVLVGAAYAHHRTLKARAAHFDAPLTIHRDIADVADLLAHVDICIGAAGSSTWERCCLGLPTVNVVLADNQREIAAALSQKGAIVDGGEIGDGVALPTISEWAAQFVAPLLQDAGKRKAMSEAARTVTDGRGTVRVLSQLLSDRVRRSPLQLRRAVEGDSALVYEWQCFPQTRRFAVNPEIPASPDHEAWMKHKVADPRSSFYIVCAGGIPAGVVRLDPGQARLPAPVLDYAGPAAKEVSIFTAPEFYQQGIAHRALLALQKRHARETIVAHVLPQNAASRALFLKVRFTPYDEEYFVWRAAGAKSTERDWS